MTLSTSITVDAGYLTYWFNPALNRHVVYGRIEDQETDSFVNGTADEAIAFLAPYRYSDDVTTLIRWLDAQR